MTSIQIQARHIKKFIELLLVDELGSYKYSPSYTRPAVNIGNTPNNITVTGVEIIISSMPVESSQRWVSSDRVSITDRWQIIAIQRDFTGSPKLTEASDKLMRSLFRPRRYFVDQSNIINTYPQCRITFMYHDAYETIDTGYIPS